ncbi:acetyltransferase [Vibrio mimicus]|nr:acetyltransferase [Vibrio mimicus]
MFTAQYFRYSGLRCSPLNAALCVFLESFHSSALIIQT